MARTMFCPSPFPKVRNDPDFFYMVASFSANKTQPIGTRLLPFSLYSISLTFIYPVSQSGRADTVKTIKSGNFYWYLGSFWSLDFKNMVDELIKKTVG